MIHAVVKGATPVPPPLEVTVTMSPDVAAAVVAIVGRHNSAPNCREAAKDKYRSGLLDLPETGEGVKLATSDFWHVVRKALIDAGRLDDSRY